MDLPSGLVELSIDRGAILHSDIFKNIDHSKFFVVIGVDKEHIAGFFYINSNVNFNVNNKQEQLDLQFEISPDKYTFLNHNSYICATDVIKIPRIQLADSINSGNTKKVDNLLQEDLDKILTAVRKSGLFSAITKQRFFY